MGEGAVLSSQYSGPTAVHSASHRQASTASVQRARHARARKMRVGLAAGYGGKLRGGW